MSRTRSHTRKLIVTFSTLLLAGVAPLSPARSADTSAAAELERWAAQAGRSADAERGRAFFSSTHGREWSCASCHGSPPSKPGRHAETGKSIYILAPGPDTRAFTRRDKVDKWFRRNCNDVLARECTAAEKADLIAYLISVQR